jgi:hypothetical protein
MKTGNILGELTAESDELMLKTSFYESRNYRELVHGTDFRFVVGRRGTGKSALFEKVAEALRGEKRVLLVRERPSEEKVGAWHHELGKLTSQYLEARKIARLAWKVQVLTQALDAILADYKAERLEHHADLTAYHRRHQLLFAQKGLARSLEALRMTLTVNPDATAESLPEKIAEHFQLGDLQDLISDALHELGRKIVFLYDGLDEGWVPNQVATGVLGGLAKLAAEFQESQGIHCLLFIRDNMFRALAEFDGDYSRNIEGNTLRLHWDEESLLNLVALRLRTAFEWRGENDVRAWNRFAKRGLEGMDGFRKCLKLTLYRPRDVIALLNGAYQVTCASNRQELIDSDVEVTATRISQTRLSDLYREYEEVLPGLPCFAEAFRGQPARTTYAHAQQLLSGVVDGEHSGPSARDFALLRTAVDAFGALYGVGFLGVQDQADGVRFCHDGSNTDVQTLDADRVVVVHPCYWRSLGLLDGVSEDDVVVKVDDEDDVAVAKSAKIEVTDMRLRKLGTVIAELGTIPEGTVGAQAFEKWVYDAARYLFVMGLDNITWKPNPDQVQQRDVVGTVKDSGAFWKRLAKYYDVSQFVIEAKNFREVKAPEFRQAWGYLKGPYGRCLLMVTRSDEEGITEHERALVKEGYDSDPHKLVIVIPAKLFQRALRKMQNRNEKRDDYIDELLKKRMDIFEREYIHQKTPRVKRS